MNPFKGKKERKKIKEEHGRKLFEEFVENKNLDELSEDDKEFANAINENFDEAIKYRIRGSQGEIAQIEMQSIVVEQNWLMIKLLNEISNKLDK